MKISVLTPCLNSEHVIGCAMESFISQDYRNIEQVIIDGQSTDRTLDIARSRASKCTGLIKIHSEQDAGIYDAINKGLRIASGDVIGVLNADDFFNSRTVLTQVADAFSARPEVGAIYGDVRFIKQQIPLLPKGDHEETSPTQDLERAQKKKTRRYYSSRLWQPWMLRFGYMPPHPSVYIRREHFINLGPYKTNYEIAGDYELLVRYFDRARLKTKRLPLCMVCMRTGGKSTKNWRSTITLNKEIVRANRENGRYTNLGLLTPKYLPKALEFLNWNSK